jgi:glycosyltransferase involved in cell wall biosynthesis
VSGLRFAMVTTFYPPYHFGGDAVFIRRLAHALVRRGHTVDIIHDVDAFELLYQGDPPAPLEEPEGVTVHSLRSRFGKLSCLLTQQTGRPIVHGAKIRRILESGDYDVIHYHNVSLVGGPGVLAYGDAIKLYMAHEHWLVCPTHVLWRHGREVCSGRECLRCTFRQKRPPQLWRYTGLLERELNHVDALISPSAFSVGKHKEFGFQREFDVIPYFLPEEDSGADASAESPWDRPYFVFVGRLEKIKGLQDVLPLFGDDAPADLLVVGSGDYESELRALGEGQARVHFLGRKPAEAVGPLYRHAIAAIVPSICYETFGIVLIEAFKQGVPVIARDLGPFGEIVQKSGGGLLFKNQRELADAIDRLAADPGLRNQLAESGKRKLQDLWMEDAVIPDYFNLVRRVAAVKGKQRVLDILGPAEIRNADTTQLKIEPPEAIS